MLMYTLPPSKEGGAASFYEDQLICFTPTSYFFQYVMILDPASSAGISK